MVTKKLDCQLIHVPRFNNFYKPLDEFVWINYMPMGLLALADFLMQNGHKSEVLHLGTEWMRDRQFSITQYLSSLYIKVIGFDMHWHYQSYDVLRVAQEIKHSFPDIFIVLGGFTASYYHEEIMREFPYIDGVIRGDGEIPLLELVGSLKARGSDLRKVQNLTWRDSPGIIVNPHSYTATAADIDKLRFANFSLLKNYSSNINNFWTMSIYLKNLPLFFNRFFFQKAPSFALPIGRGCPVSCSFCAGSRQSQQIISKRQEVIFRSHEKILETIIEAQSYGYKIFHVCFDPCPKNPDYWCGLFEKIRQKNLKISFIFDAHRLPEKKFIDAFHDTFNDEMSGLILCPESASEEVRKLNKGFFYSNQELIDTVSYIDKLGIKMEIFFSLGIPGDNIAHMKKTVEFMKMLRKKFRSIRALRSCIIELEPGSPWEMSPEKYGIVSDRACFMDFYNRHKDNSSHNYPGYKLLDFFPGKGNLSMEEFEERIKKIQCKYFCYLNINPRKTISPRLGRILCRLMQIYWWVIKKQDKLKCFLLNRSK